MNIPSWLRFVARSAALGVIISVLLLVLVPELRRGSGMQLSWFDDPSQPPEKVSYYDAISRAAPAVVNIYSNSIDTVSSFFRRQQIERTSLGSGVVMTDSGYVLTCYHVIQNAESILVSLQDGRVAEAELVGYDVYTDLAVLKIAADNLHVIPQLDDPQTRVGDLVLAIGNPYNLGQTITQGIVSRTGRNFSGRSVTASSVDFIQTDAVLNEGNSGGALVDSNGHLVGINNSNFKALDARRRVRDVDGVFFAVPYRTAKRIMDDIIANGRASHGVLGFTGSPLVGKAGVLVTNISAGGPAEVAGLREGDVILSINGTALDGINQALDFVSESSPGTVLELEVVRDQTQLQIPVTVGELLPPEQR